ncbi:MAG: glycosyltransferase family 2 protein [Luteolibacter sp.]
MKIPVSIITPVRECVSEMPAHVAHLRDLAEIAGEIIVVDSDSSDGTLDYLKEHLQIPNAVFLNHPPGLYPSWNFGISHAKYEFTTVATTGDPLPSHSLKKLFDLIQKLSADVVISPPILLNPDHSRSSRKWPIHRLIEHYQLTDPLIFPQAYWLVFLLGFFPKSPLSSCSGNLFRTHILQQNPFPEDCGHRGDVMWALSVARKVRWALAPQVESYFKFHAQSAHKQQPDPQIVRLLIEKSSEILAEQTEFLKEHGISPDALEDLREMIVRGTTLLGIETEFRATRGFFIPWFFRPKAIKVRAKRKKLKIEDQHREEKIMGFVPDIHSVPTAFSNSRT